MSKRINYINKTKRSLIIKYVRTSPPLFELSLFHLSYSTAVVTFFATKLLTFCLIT